jgi:hemolysin activation/secretion protein
VSWLFQSQYAYRLNDEGAQFIFKDNLQLTNNALLPLERIAVGGVSSVRGYRTNYLVRDEGFTLSGEVRYPLPSFEIMGQRSVISMIPFMDYGSAWNLGGPRNSLWSVGAGLSWSYMAFLGELYYGYALNPPAYRAISDAQDNGLFFRMTFEAL